MYSVKPISTKTLNSMMRRLDEHVVFLNNNSGRFGNDSVTLGELKNAHMSAIQRINDILMRRTVEYNAIDGLPQNAISYDNNGKPTIVNMSDLKKAPWEDQFEEGNLNMPTYLHPPIGKF